MTFFTIQPRTLYMYKYLFYAIEKLLIIFKYTLLGLHAYFSQ